MHLGPHLDHLPTSTSRLKGAPSPAAARNQQEKKLEEAGHRGQHTFCRILLIISCRGNLVSDGAQSKPPTSFRERLEGSAEGSADRGGLPRGCVGGKVFSTLDAMCAAVWWLCSSGAYAGCAHGNCCCRS